MGHTQRQDPPLALCTESYNPDIWHADRGTEGYRVAKLLCKACPAQQLCLEVGIKRREPDGIWGGADRAERLRMRTGKK